jgi:uncharacterized membrane protein YhaH (DUF805 family)
MHNSELGYLRSTGRISRATFLARYFWLGGVGNLVLSAIVYLIFNGSSLFVIFCLFLLLLALNIVVFIQAIKRAHDIGKSGWILWLPFYNLIVFFRKGDPVNNNYGPAPDETPQYASNIIYDQNQPKGNASKVAAWTGFLFYILTLIFYFWVLSRINNIFTPDPPKMPSFEDSIGITPNPVSPSETTSVDSDNDGVPDNKDKCPYEYGLPTKQGCPDAKTSLKPKSNSNKHTIKASSLDQLRQKIKSETAGISIDLSSIKLNLNNNSLSYDEGATQIVGLSLFWDPIEGDLNDRIYNKIIPKNSEYTCKVIVDSKYHNGLYHSLLAFVQ